MESRPHIVVINCNIEVHELLDTGECSGQCVSQEYLDKHGIKSSFLLSVKGFNLEDCVEKLKTKIKEWSND